MERAQDMVPQAADAKPKPPTTDQVAVSYKHLPKTRLRLVKLKNRLVASGAARAAVFGVNDGLVTNVGLITGVSAFGSSGIAVRIAGVVGLMSGAFSMASGEYISVKAQNEMMQHEVDRGRSDTFVPAGSARTAAQSSFLSFALGAGLPLVPWCVMRGTPAMCTSLGVAALASLASGSIVGMSSTKSVVRCACRQLFIAAVAVGVMTLAGHGAAQLK